MKIFYLIFLPIFLNFFTTSSLNARCAVCVINGMSGASIALLVIISVFTILLIANWGFNKFLKRD